MDQLTAGDLVLVLTLCLAVAALGSWSLWYKLERLGKALAVGAVIVLMFAGVLGINLLGAFT